MKTLSDGDHLYGPMWNALMQAFAGTAVISGCEVAPSGAWDTYFSVSAGQVRIGGALVTVAGGNSLLASGVAINRYDLICITAAGAIHAVRGTVAQKCPAIPAGECLIAIVYMPAYAMVINSANVYDARLLATDLTAAVFSRQVWQVAASDTAITSITGGTTDSTTYACIARTFVPMQYDQDVEFRVAATVTGIADSGFSSTAIIKILRDGVLEGAEQTETISDTGDTHTYSTDVAHCAPGQMLELWAKVGTVHGQITASSLAIKGTRTSVRKTDIGTTPPDW